MFPIIGEVIIRTNSFNTIITINGYAGTASEDGDKVSHYGEGKAAYVNSVGMGSYHEYGKLIGNSDDNGRQIYVTKGRIVAENQSNINKIYIQEGATQDSFKVEIPIEREAVVEAQNSAVITEENVSKNDNIITPIEGMVAYSYITKQQYSTLQEAIASGGKIKLLANVDLMNDTLIINDNIEIDFFGYTISGTYSDKDTKVVEIKETATVVLSDSSSGEKGGIVNKTSESVQYTYAIYNAGLLTINDGVKVLNNSMSSASTVVYSRNKTIINNANIESRYGYGIKVGMKGKLTVNDGYLNTGNNTISSGTFKGEIIINGGEFVMPRIGTSPTRISGGKFSNWGINNNKVVADGFYVIIDGEGATIDSNIPSDYVASATIHNKDCYVISNDITKLITTLTEQQISVKKNATINCSDYGTTNYDSYRNLFFDIDKNATLSGTTKMKVAKINNIGSGAMTIKCEPLDSSLYFVTKKGNEFVSNIREDRLVAELTKSDGKIIKVIALPNNFSSFNPVYTKVKLLQDVYLEKYITVNCDLVIDLNGYKITEGTNFSIWKNTIALINVQNNNMTLTIMDSSAEKTGSIVSTRELYCLDIGTKNSKKGTLIIQGGTYKTKSASAIQAEQGSLTIEDGIFEVAYVSEGKSEINYTYTINCLDENANEIIMKIKGGKFKGFNPESNSADGENTNYVDKGYTATEVDGYWIVKKAN